MSGKISAVRGQVVALAVTVTSVAAAIAVLATSPIRPVFGAEVDRLSREQAETLSRVIRREISDLRVAEYQIESEIRAYEDDGLSVPPDLVRKRAEVEREIADRESEYGGAVERALGR